MEECLSQWQALATTDSSDALAFRFQSLRVRWKELNRRLEKWLESLKVSSLSKGVIPREIDKVETNVVSPDKR